jgi:hypothetical protein
MRVDFAPRTTSNALLLRVEKQASGATVTRLSLRTTDEKQGWSATRLTEFGADFG